MSGHDDALALAHHLLRAGVAGRRKAAHKEEGKLAASFRQAMIFWDAQKADGGSFEDRSADMEKTLREVWPFEREWHYLCGQCRDTGLILYECPGEFNRTCDRTSIHGAHHFGRPCHICDKGMRFHERSHGQQSEDFTSAGKGRKRAPSGFSRMGR